MKYKKLLTLAGVLLTSLALSGCGKKVEVGSGQVGKEKTANGYQDGYHETSRFRLSPCISLCDSLVLMDVGDHEISETMSLVMPQDRLKLQFTIGGTISIREDGYDEIYKNIQSRKTNDERIEVIPFSSVYNTYAKKIINAEAREFMSKYSIDEIMANRDKVGVELSKHLREVVDKRTPFKLRYVGLSEMNYPDIITTAQENSAERREQIQQERAQLEVSRVQLERELEETRLNRKIAVEKADAEAEVNRIISESMSDAYVAYRRLEILDAFTRSNNTKIVPVSMLDTVSSQVMLGNDVSD